MIARALAAKPLFALIFVPAAWFLGTSTGVWSAIRWFGLRPELGAGVIGSLMAGLGLWMLVQIPGPLWMTIAGLISFPSGAVVGYRVALFSNEENPPPG